MMLMLAGMEWKYSLPPSPLRCRRSPLCSSGYPGAAPACSPSPIPTSTRRALASTSTSRSSPSNRRPHRPRLHGGHAEALLSPEASTDFIFANVAEELGFLGAMCIVVLFCVLGYRGLRTAYRSTDPFARLTAFGITTAILLQAFFNISVVLSLLPTKGIRCPSSPLAEPVSFSPSPASVSSSTFPRRSTEHLAISALAIPRRTSVDKVLYLSGTTRGATLENIGRSLGRDFGELGLGFIEVSLLDHEHLLENLKRVNFQEVRLIYSWVSMGLDIKLRQQDGSDVELWKELGVPFVTFHGDSPAYFFDRHIVPDSKFVSFYGFDEHRDLRKRLPHVNGPIDILWPLLLDEIPSNSSILKKRKWKDSLPQERERSGTAEAIVGLLP